jgi:hypothetical protein
VWCDFGAGWEQQVDVVAGGRMQLLDNHVCMLVAGGRMQLLDNHVCMLVKRVLFTFVYHAVCLAHRSVEHILQNSFSHTHTAPPHPRKVALPLPSTAQKNDTLQCCNSHTAPAAPTDGQHSPTLVLLAGLATPWLPSAWFLNLIFQFLVDETRFCSGCILKANLRL